MTDALRRRTATSLAVGLALSTLAAAPLGFADEIDDRKDRVESRIDDAEEHLDHSSAKLEAADRRLSRTVRELASARDTLAHTEGELAAAQALDLEMQEELADAVADLAAARRALAESRRQVSRREGAVRAVVVQQATSGGTGLLTISTVLSTQDTEELTQKLTSYEGVLDAEAATLSRLAASQVTLQLQEEAFEELEQEVAERRAAAAANLAEKERLQAQAEQAEAAIQTLTVRRSEARADAAGAKAEDLAQLEQLEAERAEIAELLRQRAEEARRAAEAEARRKAAAAAAAKPAPSAPAAPSTAQPSAPAPAPPSDGGGLSSPVSGYVTSPYGMRFHPIYKTWKLHDGTDFGAACGTPVRAAADGTVISMYYNSGYGNRIIIDHGLRGGVGLGTTYNHLSSYATSVGSHVRRGEVIGYVGTTGASTGCHLHFMVFENGATVDPMKWL
jgi:murein DD-endopeptidase MepM/ murein hydrolase activator NlpD